MPEQTAEKWHDLHKIGLRKAGVITFTNSNHVMDFCKRHGKAGETHAQTMERKANELIGRKKSHLVARYVSGDGSPVHGRLIFAVKAGMLP